MPDRSADLGKLISVHGIAPAYIQRAVFIAVLSFLFFLAMMLAFYIRQNIGYFLLSSVFLVIYLLMMFSWVMKRRNVVEIYENGLRYGKTSVVWNEVSRISDDGIVERTDKITIVLPKSLDNFNDIVEQIRSNIAAPQP